MGSPRHVSSMRRDPRLLQRIRLLPSPSLYCVAGPIIANNGSLGDVSVRTRFERNGNTATSSTRGPECRRPARELALVLVASVAYFAATIFLAYRRLLWTDEIVTIDIASHSSFAGVWNAVATGGDTLPPLGHLLTHAAMSLVDDVHVASRLPSVAGYWLMCMSIYAVLRPHTTAAAATVACLAAIPTLAYGYAFEARPYALMLGFGTFAFLCWTRAHGRHRPLWLAGLVLSLAATIASHWYAVLGVWPLVLGEAVRARRRRALDLTLVAALAAGIALPMAAVLPILQHARTFQPAMSAGAWINPHAIVGAYQTLLQGSGPLLLALLILAAVRPAAAPPSIPSPPADLITALAGFLSIPFAGALLGSLVTGVYQPRYLLLTTTGIAGTLGLIAGIVMARLGSWWWFVPGTAIAAALSGVYTQKMTIVERSIVTERAGPFALLDCTRPLAERPDLPVAVADVHSYFALHYYAGPNIANRLVYLGAYNALGTTMTAGVQTTSGWRVDAYDTFVATHTEFYVYDSTMFPAQIATPLLARLIADRGVLANGCLDVRDRYPRPGQLYLVRLP